MPRDNEFRRMTREDAQKLIDAINMLRRYGRGMYANDLLNVPCQHGWLAIYDSRTDNYSLRPMYTDMV